MQPMIHPSQPGFGIQQPMQPVPYQPPIIITTHQAQALKSCGLIGIGIFEIILSMASIGMCAYIITRVNITGFAIAGLVCAGFFLVMAIFAIHGGNNVWKNQCAISTAAALGALGVLAAVAAVIINVIALMAYGQQCEKLNFKADLSGISVDVNGMCYIAYVPIHIALIVLAVLEALFGLIISCAACCNTCSCCCCYNPPPSNAPQIIQSPAPMLPIGGPNDHYAYTRLEA